MAHAHAHPTSDELQKLVITDELQKRAAADELGKLRTPDHVEAFTTKYGGYLADVAKSVAPVFRSLDRLEDRLSKTSAGRPNPRASASDLAHPGAPMSAALAVQMLEKIAAEHPEAFSMVAIKVAQRG